MTKYILKRVGYSIVTLFLLVAITFFMMQLLPGDPFTGEKQLPAAQMEALYAKYGLDKPVWQQFFIYIGNVVQGDLGVSLTYNRAVTLMITEAFAISFDVGIRSICFAFIGGVLLGTLAAIKRGKVSDTVAMIIALLGVSVPSFVVASILQYFLGLKLVSGNGHAPFRRYRLGRLQQPHSPGYRTWLRFSRDDLPSDAYQHAGRSRSGLHQDR